MFSLKKLPEGTCPLKSGSFIFKTPRGEYDFRFFSQESLKIIMESKSSTTQKVLALYESRVWWEIIEVEDNSCLEEIKDGELPTEVGYYLFFTEFKQWGVELYDQIKIDYIHETNLPGNQKEHTKAEILRRWKFFKVKEFPQ